MRGIISNKPLRVVVFLFLEILSIAMGMGVPIFTILFGFLVGLFIPRILRTPSKLSTQDLASILKAALIPSSVTLMIMALIWLPTLTWLFDSTRDLTNFGIPMILFSPRASFIGWIVLMVLISPFLQFLMTLFGSISWIVFIPNRWRNDISSSGNELAG
jgi:hypothetical protein